MLFLKVIWAVNFVLTTCAFSPEIELENPHFNTSCNQSLIIGKDSYQINGTAGPNINDSISSGWAKSLTVHLSSDGTNKGIEICRIILGTGGIFCTPYSNENCFCDGVNATGTAHFVISYKAQESHSGGIISVSWMNSNTSALISSKQVNLYNMYDFTKAKLAVIVGENKVTITDKCNVDLTTDNDNIKVCCENTASPCDSILDFGGFDISAIHKDLNCTKISFKTPNVTFTGNWTYSLAVCAIPDVKKGFCTVTVKAIESSTAVTSTSNSETTISAKEQTASDNNLGLKIGLPVGLGTFAIVICAVGIICYKMKRRNAAKLSSDQQLTKQNAAENSPNDDGNKTSSTENGANKMGTDENKSNKAEINKPANSIQHSKDIQEHEGKEEVSKDTKINGNIYSNSQSRPLPAIKGSVSTRPVSIEETRGNLNNPN